MNRLYLLFLTVFMLGSYMPLAQSPLTSGEKQVNFGLGFGDGVPVYGGIDFGVWENVTIGGQFSYRTFDDNGFDLNVFGLLGNINYHLDELLVLPVEWNVYAGGNIGYVNYSSPNGYNGDRDSGLGIGAQVGGRYFFNDKWAINLELSGGNQVNDGKIGATLKF